MWELVTIFYVVTTGDVSSEAYKVNSLSHCMAVIDITSSSDEMKYFDDSNTTAIMMCVKVK